MRTSALLIILLGSLAGVTASCGRNLDVRQSSPAEAAIPVGIVYARWTEDGTEILWRKPMARDEVVLYASSSCGIIPDELGYLPSPDGKWLLVWDTEQSSAPDGDQSITRWLVIRLADGKRVEIGKVPGEAWLLPYWQDSQHLLFMGVPEEAISFDLETSLLSGSLEKKEMAGVLISERAKLRLVEYFRQYYKPSRKHLKSALERLNKQLDVGEYYASRWLPEEPPAFLVLRTLGIPGQERLQVRSHGMCYRHIRFAFSPDYSLITRSYMWQPESSKHEEVGAGSRLQVFQMDSGRLVWSIGFPSKHKVLPKVESQVNPPPLPFTSPEIWDTRFSTDGRYLSFTTSEEDVGSGHIVRIVDTANWQEILRLPDAMNSFVIPMPEQSK